MSLLEIKSQIADQQDFETWYLVLSSITNRGLFNVSLGIGKVKNNDVLLSSSGLACIDRLTALASSTGEQCLLIDLTKETTRIGPTVLHSFEIACPGDQLFFICGSDKIYDEVAKELHITPINADSCVVALTKELV